MKVKTKISNALRNNTNNIERVRVCQTSGGCFNMTWKMSEPRSQHKEVEFTHGQSTQEESIYMRGQTTLVQIFRSLL